MSRDDRAAGGAGPDFRTLLTLSRRQVAATRAGYAAIGRALFAGDRATLSDRDRALITSVIRRMVGDAEAAILRAARSVADSPAAALGAGEDLFERMAAAGMLEDDALIEPALHRMREFRLESALARTPGGAWAGAGDNGAAEAGAVLAGPAGRAAQAAIEDHLAGRPLRTDVYRNPVLPLAELDEAAARTLFWSTAAAMSRPHDAPRGDEDVALDGALAAAAEHALAELAASGGDSRLAAAVDALAGAGRLDAALAVEALRLGEAQLCVALLARLSGLRPALVYRMAFAPGDIGLAILARAVAMAREDFADLVNLLRPARGAGAAGGEASADPLDLFDDLPPDEAGKVLAYWRLPAAYLRALWRHDRARGDHG